MTQPLTIREYRPADLEQVLDLVRISSASWRANSGVSR